MNKYYIDKCKKKDKITKTLKLKLKQNIYIYIYIYIYIKVLVILTCPLTSSRPMASTLVLLIPNKTPSGAVERKSRLTVTSEPTL